MSSSEPSRDLVEAWGVRGHDPGTQKWLEPMDREQDAQHWAKEWVGTVVPLIAADRLTSREIVDVIDRAIMDGKHAGSAERVAAALRAHLESA